MEGDDVDGDWEDEKGGDGHAFGDDEDDAEGEDEGHDVVDVAGLH